MASAPVDRVNGASNASDDGAFSVLHHPGSRSSSVIGDEDGLDHGTAAESAILDAEGPVTFPRTGISSGQAADESIARAAMYYDRLDRLLDRLETRIDIADVRARMDRRGSASSSSSSYLSGPGSDSGSEIGGRPAGRGKTDSADKVRAAKSPPGIISAVKEGGWAEFVNRFSPDESVYAVEALVTNQRLVKAIIDESDQRGKHGGPRAFIPRESRRLHKVDDNDTWIQRIRIQSKALLGVFGRVTGFEWGTKPHTFVRPFQYLVHHHDDFKAELERLQSDSEGDLVNEVKESLEQTTLNPPVVAPGSYHDPRPQVVAELEDLRCYVDFIENKLVPEMDRFREETYSGRLKIRFDDLWYLFTPGELVYVPLNSMLNATENQVARLGIPIEDSSHETSMHQSIWRLGHTYVPPAEVCPTNTARLDARSFDALCYYLDYDGAAYGAVGFRFKMPYFEGERDVRDLAIYPLKYALAADELLREAREIGRMYTEAVTRWHLTCNGWTFVTDPIGLPILDSNYVRERRQKRPEHIEGEVIVDFKEAFNSHPSHKASFLDGTKVTERQSMGGIVESPHQVVVWADEKRSKMVFSTTETLVTDDNCQAAEHNAALDLVPYFRKSTRPTTILSDDDLVLLPRRIFVYSLRQRRFAAVNVQHVKPPQVREDAISHLQLQDDHKKMIQAAVHAHLRRQRIERCLESQADGEIPMQDLIANKGRGLLIMLHGEPGVGKTATAEAVAQSTGRPLFPISCSDLLGPGWPVEERLTQILRLSHLWDCVLLLDEADVFLAARSLREGPNHLVSMFLRKLEYYNGILFLTTNRIGKLDPALTSRIHLILHYKRLGFAEAEKIFRTNISLLQDAESQHSAMTHDPPLNIDTPDVLRFAADHYNKFPKGKGAWNGRQIRNAFVVAAALARGESESLGLEAMGVGPRLRYDHFAEVERLTLEYDRFRAKVLGGDDAFKAKFFQERDDDYEGGEKEGKKKGEVELMRILYAAQQALAAATKEGKDKGVEKK